MKIKVRAFGGLMGLLGKETVVDLEPGSNLADLAAKLGEKTGNLRRGFLGRYRLGRDLVVLVNGRNIHTLEGLETPLKQRHSSCTTRSS